MRAESAKNRLSRDRTRAFDYFDTQNGGQKWPREVFSIRDSRPVRAVSRHTCQLNRQVERSRALERRECSRWYTLPRARNNRFRFEDYFCIAKGGRTRAGERGETRICFSPSIFFKWRIVKIFRNFRWKQIWKNYCL